MNSTSGGNGDPVRQIRQQEVVAELGQRALETDDIDQLMRATSVAVTEALDSECAKILELLPDGDELVLRHGVGVNDELVGAATTPAANTQAGYTLRSERPEPVIVDGRSAETRFSELEPFTDRDVNSGISAIIGSTEDPWGVLETHASEARTFTEHDASFVQNVANVLATAIENAQSQRELGDIYGRISDAFFALNEDWEFTYLNDRANEIINPENRELLGSNIWEVFPEAVSQEFKPKYERAMYEQETVSFEEYYPDPLDSWFEVRAYPSETGLSVYFQDITERKERERELELFRTLLNHSNDVVLVIEPQTGRLLDANETAYRRLGYERDELVGSSVLEVEQRFSDLEEWRSHVEDVKAEGMVTITGEHERKDGTSFPAEVNVSYVELEQAQAYMIAVVRDVSDLREYERKLEESNERLEQFAYAVSHDLQEPLRMVSSYLQLIENRYANELGDEGEEFLEFAVDGAERMRDMINGLLTYSRVETRGDPFETVDLNVVLDDVLADLQLQIDESDAEITADPLPKVEGDEGQLRQVFQNLLSNAIAYSGDEPPRIHIDAERTGSTWTVSVHDEGIGIDSENQDRVFEVFQRLHDQDDHAGTGIGLALCRRIIERHGGEIWVESEPGKGSTFSFTLQAARYRDS